MQFDTVAGLFIGN